jgi:hypothetical protein
MSETSKSETDPVLSGLAELRGGVESRWCMCGRPLGCKRKNENLTAVVGHRSAWAQSRIRDAPMGARRVAWLAPEP